jgi:hypothetical protein
VHGGGEVQIVLDEADGKGWIERGVAEVQEEGDLRAEWV